MSGLRTDAQQRGDAGEQLAFALLLEAGLRAVGRNLRFKVGELDLVMEDGETLVFIEVRRRGREDFGGALESIDRRKAQKFVRAAKAFLQQHPRYAHWGCRFDVVAIDDGRDAPEWMRGAFTLDDV